MMTPGRNTPQNARAHLSADAEAMADRPVGDRGVGGPEEDGAPAHASPPKRREARRRKTPAKRACAWPPCNKVFETTRAWTRYCPGAPCKRNHEREIRRAGKASNMSPADAERAERAEALLRWAEDSVGRAPALMNIYRRFVTPAGG
jgi:hypothetical protein